MAEVVTRIEALPIWTGPVGIAPLSGGLSNANFTVTDGDCRFVVRLGEDLPFHHVFRDREAAVSRAAHAAGVSPALVHAEPGAMVFQHIAARTFDADAVRADLARIVALLKAAHGSVGRHVAGPAPFFSVFHVIRDYARQLRAARHREADRLDGWLATADRLEAEQVPLPIVFGHHDLLPANILDDGSRLWLVDWEYGGYGTPLFDLANLAGNAGFRPDEEAALLSDYFGATPEPGLARAFSAMKAASLLREALWSMISELHLTTPGVDFVAYADENLARFAQALAAHDASRA
ncbi:phosphotransferase family protein [Chthonobacter rhizosphaerae]|uniref:phosphotransferase family protein n=1 Tax=Chthonobacter rhizosphaerae TaxID=2735553 RepID=UPI0015EF580B|nr:phosphotransferase family protein [Chthonobacter rhizosphaerae]